MRDLRDVILALIGAAGFAWAMSGCMPSEPYTWERPTEPFHVMVQDGRGVNVWFADGHPTVLTVHNPTKDRVQIHVMCEPSVPPSYIDYGHMGWWLCLDPKSETRRLVEFMNIDAIRKACHVQSWWRIKGSWTCIEGGN